MTDAEATKRDAGLPFVDARGNLVTRVTAPTPPAAYVCLTEYQGDVIGVAVIWSGPGGHERGLRVWDSPVFGRDLGLPAADRVYVPVVPEAEWWASKLTGAQPTNLQYVERYALWVAA